MIFEENSPVDLFRRLKGLGMAGTVLHLAAHPDDEDIGLLSHIVFKQFGRAVYWSATRGEGGQNSVNAYGGKALGVYRTWESMDARRLSGGECLFGPFIDFGYSKNGREALSKWGREHMLREQVRAIRLTQPHVVICRWTGSPEDLHGHHQAVGELMQTAFQAAGDRKIFPELEDEGIYPWQPLKLYCSLNNDGPGLPAAAMGNVSGKSNPAFEKQGALRIDTGEFDPLLGRTIQELAWQGYNAHKTQGIGMLPAAGDFYYYLSLIQSRVPLTGRQDDLFCGFDPTLTGLAAGGGVLPAQAVETLGRVKACVDQACKSFHPQDPLPAGITLLAGATMLRCLRSRLQQTHAPEHGCRAVCMALDRKIEAFDEVIAECLGLRLEAVCTRRNITPGESFWMSVRLWNHRKIALEKDTVEVDLPRGWRLETIADWHDRPAAGPLVAQGEVFVASDAQLSCPFWIRDAADGYRYSFPASADAQRPMGRGPIRVTCGVAVNGHRFDLHTEGLHKKAFAGGFSHLPPIVVPPISLHPESEKKFVLLPARDNCLALTVTARCNDDERPAEGQLRLIAPPGWHTAPESLDLRLAPGGGAQSCTFKVTMAPGAAEGCHVLEYRIQCRGREYGVIMTPVRMGAPGLADGENAATCIREEVILDRACVAVHVIDAKFDKNSPIAFVEGAPDGVPGTMTAMGIGMARLGDHEIEHGNLNQFDAIVIGPKAYNLRQVLRENAHRFLDYVENGGTLVVNYQWYGYEQQGLAPYPFKFHRPVDRVTDEEALVVLLDPADRLFQFPNPIHRDDFNGWIHDRGLAFWRSWDPNYQPYLSCADPQEPPQEGGLVGCRYGRGNYFYVGYSLSRQLPAGVPGAFRLFFNLLSAGRGADTC